MKTARMAPAGLAATVAAAAAVAAYTWRRRQHARRRLRAHCWWDVPPGLLAVLETSVDVSTVELTVGASGCPSDVEVCVFPNAAWEARVDVDGLASLASLVAIVVPYAGIMPKHLDRLRAILGGRLGSTGEGGVALHNLHHNGPITAEMAIALLLAAAKRLIPADRRIRQHDWRPRGLPFAGAQVDPPEPMVMLDGRTALVLGLGGVGSRVAAVCAALGMAVLATKRSARLGGEGGGSGIEVHPPGALRELLPRADALLVCLPGTEETRGLIGAEELALLPRHAVVVNVGRGAVIDEHALYAALREGRLHGAGLDVWWSYPATYEEALCTPPSAFPYGELDRVVLSPHRGGGIGVADLELARMRRIGEMLSAAGRDGVERMPHRWDFGLGY
mmetsp:Transcript_8840/g.26021  ORF Transcript_8840/g.26021 Transcript_8840/m.26021 type:complete len:391 (+) Transcript_8840:132-1304(+)